MALSFAHPELAVGALLALLPLAIHLFNRQRARPRPFGAIAFLMRSSQGSPSVESKLPIASHPPEPMAQ